MIEESLSERIHDWLAEDPDPVTRKALDDLRRAAQRGDAGALDELRQAFAGPLTFGTAGLRGPLGPGPGRMNRVVVIRAASGLAAYLNAHDLSGGRVLVGYDARHNSQVFATDTAGVLAASGLRPMLCSQPLPTPVIAFGIRHLSCVAAVMVTASHNPACDNGYKVYLGDGCQIVPPADAEIAARIDEVGALATIPRATTYQVVGDELLEAYLTRAASLVEAGPPRKLTWVYTALHGVGSAVLKQVVARAGLPQPMPVVEQDSPDPDFPTVVFPNPEEPGAVDLAMDLARRSGAELVIANDPDADRCAVATQVDQAWRMLSGDELGALLADHLLRRGVRGTYASSVVSSTLLGTMATAHGQPHVTTLTGFKWLGRVPGLVFGYEEAIGYCTDPTAVSDKDGITTALRVLELTAELRSAGLGLADRLDEIARRYGLHLTAQQAYRVDRLEVIGEAMRRIRQAPPPRLAGEPVRVSDLAPGGAQLQPTDALLFEGVSVRAVVRPSGTEPKLKCYLQVKLTPEASQDPAEARMRAGAVLDQIAADLGAALGL